MTRTTRKLSGACKDRFFVRFFAEEPGLESEIAGRLAARSQATFTSVRVRRIARPLATTRSMPAPAAAPAPVTASHPIPAETPSPAPTAFDPYVFGLVPVFQREGRDGLIARLATVIRVEDLRLMARTQQIVLPEALRTGDVEVGALRQAIADAVAKRIADRRAAAG